MSEVLELVVMPADPVEEVAEIPVRMRAMNRFLFDHDLSMPLLYEVQLCCAHVYASGRKQGMFEKVREGILNSSVQRGYA